MRVLVACEQSGVVRRAFDRAGHDAWSCDLLPAEDGSNHHIRGDVRAVLNDGWDLMMVAHPPCTRLCNSGVRWLDGPPEGKTVAQMWAELDEGAALFSDLWNAPIERICVENPIMHKHAKARIRNYAEFKQSVQPYDFGHVESKRTCFWLKNLPPLVPTTPRTKEDLATLKAEHGKAFNRIHNATPGPDRWKERSRTFDGIAAAMADQWGKLGTRDYAPEDIGPLFSQVRA
jgi:hypothetical protein